MAYSRPHQTRHSPLSKVQDGFRRHENGSGARSNQSAPHRGNLIYMVQPRSKRAHDRAAPKRRERSSQRASNHCRITCNRGKVV